MIQLQQGDCLELMKSIPDGSVDMVLCDLPYGMTPNDWDKPLPLEPLWEQYKRVCKTNAAIVLFATGKFAAGLIMSNLKMYRYDWVWAKSLPVGFLCANRMPMRAHEQILVFYRRLPTYNPQKEPGEPYSRPGNIRRSGCYSQTPRTNEHYDGARYPKSVVHFSNGNHNLPHPTAKPTQLLEYLIKTYTNPGEVVLDNTMGSGSTGVAAVNTGRSFIGMELDEHYFEVAQQRINEAVVANG